MIVCKKVCDECPFRKDSLQGWLGDLSLEDTMDCMQFEGIFTCHMTRTDSPQENLRKALSEEQPICRGFLLSSIKSCKLFGQADTTISRELARLQKKFKETLDYAELDEVLAKHEFRNHHTI